MRIYLDSKRWGVGVYQQGNDINNVLTVTIVEG